MPPKAKPDTAGYIKLKKDLSAKTPGQLLTGNTAPPLLVQTGQHLLLH